MPSSAAAIYRYALNEPDGQAIELETAEGVFIPTHTSQLLLKAARQAFQGPGRLLDLGCGIGICGLVSAKLGLCGTPVYLSDVSARAMEVAQANAKKLEVPAVIRQGPLFEPWPGERFDQVIADVPGISEEIARLSPWFPDGVECQTGRDGTALVVRMLEEAPAHLAPHGVLLFPVLSLSDERRILEAARRHFPAVTLMFEETWLLPQQLLARFDKLKPLMDEGTIRLKQTMGMWVWSIQVYRASLAAAPAGGCG